MTEQRAIQLACEKIIQFTSLINNMICSTRMDMFHTYNAGKKSVTANMSIYLVLVFVIKDYQNLMRLSH